MKIEKSKTGLGEQMIEFKDQSASDLRMWVEEHSKQGKGTKILYFDTDADYFKFSQGDIKALLPYLQAYAETGQLEPQQSPLQGESERIQALKEYAEWCQSREPNVKIVQFPLFEGEAS